MALIAYFDAGGDETLPTLSAAGFIARAEQWNLFNEEWAIALAAAGVSSLHMRDFAHSVGQFELWKGDEPRRAQFLSHLTSIVRRHTMKHVAVTLLISIYDQLNAKATVRERLGSPYVLTMLNAILLAQHWRDSNLASEPLAVCLEHGDKDQTTLLEVLKRVEFPHEVAAIPKRSIVDGRTSYVLPFQAADFLAYEYQKAMRTMREGGVTEIKARRSFRGLLPVGEDLYSRVIDVHGLAELCKAFGVRRRIAS